MHKLCGGISPKTTRSHSFSDLSFNFLTSVRELRTFKKIFQIFFFQNQKNKLLGIKNFCKTRYSSFSNLIPRGQYFTKHDKKRTFHMRLIRDFDKTQYLGSSDIILRNHSKSFEILRIFKKCISQTCPQNYFRNHKTKYLLTKIFRKTRSASFSERTKFKNIPANWKKNKVLPKRTIKSKKGNWHISIKKWNKLMHSINGNTTQYHENITNISHTYQKKRQISSLNKITNPEAKNNTLPI